MARDRGDYYAGVDPNAKAQTAARNGKPRDVAAMKQKQMAQQEMSAPSNIPVPSAAPARMESGNGLGDFLDYIMGTAMPGATQKSFGENAPSTMTAQDRAMMDAAARNGAAVGSMAPQEEVASAEGNGSSASASANDPNAIDEKTAADIDAMDAEGWSLGEIAGALGGVVGAGALAAYLARDKGKKVNTSAATASASEGQGPDMIDNVMDKTDSEDQKAKYRATSVSEDADIQNKVEGRDNTPRPGPNRFKQDMNSSQLRTNYPVTSDVDMTIDKTLGDRANQMTADVDAIIDQAASLDGRTGAQLLRQNGIELTDDVLRRIVERQAGNAASRAVR